MEEMIIFRPVKGTENLTVNTLRVMKAVSKKLGDRSDRVDYGAIGRETGLTWNGVKYAVNVLVKANVLENEGGKLTVLKKIVI